MKIKRQGVRITDVPGVSEIDVTPESVKIIFMSEQSGVRAYYWTPDQFREFVEACQTTLAEIQPPTATSVALARGSRGSSAVVGSEVTEEMVPHLPVGMVLADRDGEEWTVRESGSGGVWVYWKDGSEGKSAMRVFDLYSPFTIKALPGSAA